MLFFPVHPSSVTSQNVLTLVFTQEQNRNHAGPCSFDIQFIMHEAKVMLTIIEKMVYKRNYSNENLTLNEMSKPV